MVPSDPLGGADLPTTVAGPGRTQAITVGDRVVSSRPFSRSIGAYGGAMPHARGRVTTLIPVGTALTWAAIARDKPDFPIRVNVKNLCLGDRLRLDE